MIQESNPKREIMTTTPQVLACSLPANPSPSDFVALGQHLIGAQPSLMGLIGRCADSMQAEKRAKFEAGFIIEKMRLMGNSGEVTEETMRAIHLKRCGSDYESLEAHMAWWAWQTASSTN